MSDFAGMEDLLQDFLVEATDLLSDVDNKLVDPGKLKIEDAFKLDFIKSTKVLP